MNELVWRIQDGFTHLSCALATTPNKTDTAGLWKACICGLSNKPPWGSHFLHGSVGVSEIVFQF